MREPTIVEWNDWAAAANAGVKHHIWRNVSYEEMRKRYGAQADILVPEIECQRCHRYIPVPYQERLVSSICRSTATAFKGVTP